ncbi:MAG: phosphonate C-P lyase system protein PhnG [Alphaproteobacteria bacterium]|nr:phosphonate C-P lyase system protein PhnG [Alphaproteobacteria bacterium]
MPEAPLPSPERSERQRWMAVLARAPEASLAAALAAEPDLPAFTHLRRPEIGMAMTRGRAGGTGIPFNLGEMTVTRCAVQLPDGTQGHAYLAGRAPRRAELAALLDALLQAPSRRPRLMAALVEPEAARLAEARTLSLRKAAATRVDFFAMVRMG